MHLLSLNSLPLIFSSRFYLSIFTESLGSKTVIPWVEVGKESENELVRAAYVKGIITSTTQTYRHIQARKALQATREGRERFGQGESWETVGRDTESSPKKQHPILGNEEQDRGGRSQHLSKLGQV